MTAAPETEAGPAPGRAAALDLRVLRALPFATVSVVLAVAGHTLASGAAVPAGAVLLGWGLTGAAAVCGGRRERSLSTITGALGAAQLGLHLLFHLAQGAGAPGMAGMPGMSSMPAMPGMPSAAAPVAPHALGWAHALLLGLSPAMLAAHLVATVLAGWWLRQGRRRSGGWSASPRGPPSPPPGPGRWRRAGCSRSAPRCARVSGRGGEGRRGRSSAAASRRRGRPRHYCGTR